MMADDQPLDPAKLMRAFFTAWDQGRAPASPAADAPSADTGALAPAMRLMAQALAVANMPSREDIGRLAERLDRIEALLGDIDRRLTDLAAGVADGDDPPPTTKKERKKKR